MTLQSPLSGGSTRLLNWRDFDLDQLKPGEVLESNSYVLGSLVKSCGGMFSRHDMVMDDAHIAA